MTPVDGYAADLVSALEISGKPLESTRMATVPDHELLAELTSATFGYLANPAAFSTNARLLDGINEVPRERWTTSRLGHGQVIHTELLNSYIDEAVTRGQLFVVDSIDECLPLMMRLREAIEYRLQASAWINVYLTAAKETNFGLHSDTHDTIIVQLLGRKVWHVDDAPRGVPVDLTLDRMPKYELSPPQVLAMAGNTAHNVAGVGELTLHLTIGFDRDAGLTPRLDEIQALLGRDSWPVTADERAFGMASTTVRRTGSSLPFSATHNLEHCRFVRWASRLPPFVESGSDGQLVVRSRGRRHLYSGAHGGLIAALVEGAELTVNELLSIGGIGPEALLEFLVQGVEDGTLICRI